MTTPSSPARRTALTVLLFFGGCIGFQLEEDWRSDRSLSPGPCRTIECFVRTKPTPVSLTEVRVEGRDYLVWFGESKPMWLFASGPSCYVFDKQGRLVTWSSLTGEGGDIERYSGPALQGKPVALDAVLPRVGRE